MATSPVSFSHGDSEGRPPPPRQWQVLYQPSCREARTLPTCQPALSSLTCSRGQLGPRDLPSTFHFLLTLPLCCCDLTLNPCGHPASSALCVATWEFPEGPSPVLPPAFLSCAHVALDGPACDPWALWHHQGRRGWGSHRVWHSEPARRLPVTPSA